MKSAGVFLIIASCSAAVFFGLRLFVPATVAGILAFIGMNIFVFAMNRNEYKKGTKRFALDLALTAAILIAALVALNKLGA